jgi:tetratricopeptide (TPR) repeat protein
MKNDRIIRILAVLALIACFVLPVMAAEEPEKDAGTRFYNGGSLRLTTGDYEGAITMFDLALASNTTMIRMSDGLLYTYRDKSYAQIQLGRYEDAVQTTNAGLAEYSKDKMLWNNKGYALYRLGKFEDALNAYNRAIKADEEYTTALINKGDTLYAMGRYKDAIDSYNKALGTDPNNSNATKGRTKAQDAAFTSSVTTMIVYAAVVIIALGAVVWYVKFRTPAGQKPGEKKAKEKKK